MDVSIIIVNYHSVQLIRDCVESIRKFVKRSQYEIIIVDNSVDASEQQALSELDDAIRVIDPKSNLGFGNANNLGASYATGKYVFCLNPDTILLNDAVSILKDYLDQNADVGVAGANLFTKDGLANASYCVRFNTLKGEKRDARITTQLYSKIKTKYHFKYRHPNDYHNYSEQPLEVAYLYGADIMMPRSLFERIHGFDPDFFMYYEEEELQYRISQLGLKRICLPQAKIIHLEGATINPEHEMNERQITMRLVGLLTYYDKRYGIGASDRIYRIRKKAYRNKLILEKMLHNNTENVLQLRSILDKAYNQYRTANDHG